MCVACSAKEVKAGMERAEWGAFGDGSHRGQAVGGQGHEKTG